MILRAYGPDESIIEQTWIPPVIEVVKLMIKKTEETPSVFLFGGITAEKLLFHSNLDKHHLLKNILEPLSQQY